MTKGEDLKRMETGLGARRSRDRTDRDRLRHTTPRDMEEWRGTRDKDRVEGVVTDLTTIFPLVQREYSSSNS